MKMHKFTSSKVSNDVAHKYSYFVGEIVNQDSMNTRIKGKEFYIMSIIRMLEPLTDGDKSFNELLRLSCFGHKRSFLNYLDMCKHFEFIQKEKLSHNAWYRLTVKGKTFLDLFK